MITMFDDDEQTKMWTTMFDRIERVMRKYGKEDAFAKGDYFVLDENWGPLENRVEINNLLLLRPEVIEDLQAQLHDVPTWRIMITVDVRGKEDLWPPMGLIVRRDEIIDGLQRAYLPEDVRGFHYRGSRPGTAND